MTHASEANFWTLPDEQGGEPAYVAQALAQGVVFAECPEDRDWAGLLATITTAIDAFDRGVMGPRGSQFSLPAALPSSREADMLRADVERLTQELAEARAALDDVPCTRTTDPDVTLGSRLRAAMTAWMAERREASHLADLCQATHDALDGAGVPGEGSPAKRVMRLVRERDLALAPDAAR